MFHFRVSSIEVVALLGAGLSGDLEIKNARFVMFPDHYYFLTDGFTSIIFCNSILITNGRER